MPPRKPSTADEIARLAAQMRVADPNVDNGAFSSLTTNDAMNWIMGIGHINEIDPRMKPGGNPEEQREIATENLRLLLWDVQRSAFALPRASRNKFKWINHTDSSTYSPKIPTQKPRISSYPVSRLGRTGKNHT
jgi:hypothetical protein